MTNASLFLLFLLIFTSNAQYPPIGQPEKCTIEGQVVKAGTGEPLKKAQVALRKAEARERAITVWTGQDGRFLFKDVEPGRYRLAASRNGYVEQEYGQRTQKSRATIMTLVAGQNLRDIVFRLIPTAVIAGRVYDEDGEPMPRVDMQALEYQYVRGERRLASVERAVSNDLGEYRLYGLAPGHYYVSATYRPRAAVAFGRGSVISRGRDRRGSAEAGEAYAPTYYPGTNDPGGATPLQLRAGEEMRSIDFTLLTTRTVRVRGRVFNGITGRPAGEAQISLLPREIRAGAGFRRNSTSVRSSEGDFELQGVIPGSYFLFAFWMGDEARHVGRLPLEVGSTDIDGITVTIEPGIELPGRVQVEGQLQPSASSREEDFALRNLRVFLQSRDPLPIRGASTRVKDDGTFVLENVSQGDYRVSVSGAPPDYYLKAARVQSRDVLEEGLNVSGLPPSDGLKLVLSAAGVRIEGVVVTDEQQPFSGATVVLVPEARRRDDSNLYKSASTDQYGRFQLRGIGPGEYKLFAWEEVEPGAYQDAVFLRPYEDQGAPVQVQEGTQLSVQLRLIPADE